MKAKPTDKPIVVPKEKKAKTDATYKQFRLKKLKEKQKRKKSVAKPKTEGKKKEKSDVAAPKMIYERCDPKEFLHIWEKFLNAKQLSAVEKEDFKLDGKQSE